MVKVESGICTDGGNERLAPETYEAFRALYAAIPGHLKAKDSEYGKLSSGFRSYADQAVIFQKAVEKNKKANPKLTQAEAEKVTRKWNAKPGTSAHHTGNAVDLWMGWPMSSTNAKKMSNGLPAMSRASFEQRSAPGSA